MPKIFDIITELCQQEGWELIELTDGEVAMIEVPKENGLQWDCFAHAREPQNQIVFYSLLTEKVSLEKRATVAEFLTRLNYGLTIGNFEMSFDSGDVRYKTSMDFDKSAVTVDLISPLIYANITIVGKFLPILLRVISGEISPVDAIKRAKSV